MRIANLVTAGEYWRPINQSLSDDAARRGLASVESYSIGYPPGLAGTSQLSMTIADLLHVNAGLRAHDAGCDAIFVNAVPDYGVPLLRDSVPVPVIGAGEASILTARSFGERFSIVTVWPESSGPLYDRLLAQTQMAAHCASVVSASNGEEASSDGNSAYADLEARDASLLDRLEAACRRAFDEDGADCVILGCTCMHPIAGSLAACFDRPVLDPVIVGWRFAEMAADLVPIAGGTRAGAAVEHRNAFRAILAGASEWSIEADCEVCEVTAAAVAG